MRALLLALALLAPRAAAEPLALPAALGKAEAASVAVAEARRLLSEAQAGLEASRADPLAVRLDQLQAEYDARSAELALRNAFLGTRVAAATAFTTALEAEDAVEAAELARDIASVTLEAQQVRFEAGAITALELDRARNDLQGAERDVASSRAARELAFAELARLLGTPPGALERLAPTVTEEPVPELQELVERALAEHADVWASEVAQRMALARLAAVDHALSSRREVEAARALVSASEARSAETRGVVELAVRQRYLGLVNARGRYDHALAGLETAREEFAAQRARHEVGAASPLQLRRAEAALLEAEASVRSLLHDLMLARLELEQAVLGR